MKVEQFIYRKSQETIKNVELGDTAQLLLVFGSKNYICDEKIFENLRKLYSKAYIMGCTTSGEIYNDSVFDNTLSVTAVCFEKTNIIFSKIELKDKIKTYEAAGELAKSIPSKDLKHFFVLSEGININGSKFVEGLRENLPKGVIITGGLSGDGDRFEETYIIANEKAQKNVIAAVGLYGNSIKTGYGSVGGWDTFGIERIVTKSEGNELFEIDNKPILDLYKEYLGEYSKDLPASGLFFPLYVRSKNYEYSYVRTVSSINEEYKSMIFIGEIPEGSYCRLMKANFLNLVNGAKEAAQMSSDMLKSDNISLAILISCIGRKLVLNQMIDEEIEATREVLGKNTLFTGFYSYGEISPQKENTACEFHNQTMTITVWVEV